MGKISATSKRLFLRFWPVPAAAALIALPFLGGWWRLERLRLPAGEEIRAEARIVRGRKPVRIGDPVIYAVVVRARPGHSIGRPRAPEAAERYQLKQIAETGTQRILGGVRREFRYELRPFVTGRLRIGPSRVSFRRSGKASSIATEAVYLDVHSLLPEDAENAALREAKPPLNLPIDYRLAALFLLIPIILTLAVAAFIRRLRGRERRRAIEEVTAPNEPAHLSALRELEALRVEVPGPAEPFFVRLSSCLRFYLQNRYGLNAPDLTTEELLPLAAANLNLPAGAAESLASLARLWDTVKFARVEPAAEITSDALDRALDFVMLTKEEERAEEIAPEEGRAS